MRARTAFLLLAAALLALPGADAHLEFQRPSIQAGETQRLIEATVSGPAATFRLVDRADPLRNAVRHEVDPSEALVLVEHRRDPPQAHDAFTMRVGLVRLAEYRDLNADGRFTPDLDAAVKAWRFENQPWQTSPVQNATVGGAPARSVSWGANLTGNPHFDLTLAATGYDVTDEGARARPQDVLLYLDVKDLPPRGTGSLHFLEATVTAPAGSTLAQVLGANNHTVGVHVDHDGRRGFFLWGGQAAVDGREQLVLYSQEGPVVEKGNATWTFRLGFPLMDRSARLVMVSGVEYAPPDKGAPAPGAWALLATGAACALLLGRRGRAQRMAGRKSR